MTDELLKKRFVELSARAHDASRFLYTDFLSTHELSLINEVKRSLACPYAAFGGAEGCERQIARFGDPDACPEGEPPITCVCVEPLNKKFSDELTHRDFLGALMAMGMERELFGDIVLRDGGAYIFCLSRAARVVTDELREVKRTSVRAYAVEALPEGELYSLKETALSVASERIDLIIAKAFRLSREESAALFARELVFIDSAACKNSSAKLKPGCVVSVRGYGRFVYNGVDSQSRKGKLRVKLGLYC